MIMIVILCLKIFYHALVNYDKNNKYINNVMKLPYFLELIIMLMLNINVIILYKIEFCFWVLFYEIILMKLWAFCP